MSNWIEGIPPAELVKQHESHHPRVDGVRETIISISESEDGKVVPPRNVESDGQSYGEWICLHPASRHTEQYLSIVTLKEHGGMVLLRNGFTFWQPLDKTRWGAKCRYFPVGKDGLPTDYKIVRYEPRPTGWDTRGQW